VAALENIYVIWLAALALRSHFVNLLRRLHVRTEIDVARPCCIWKTASPATSQERN